MDSDDTKDKTLLNNINKLCLNLHSCLINLPDEYATDVNKVYITSLLHPVFNLFIKIGYDEELINEFNSEYIKRYPYLRIYNNVLWDIFRAFKRCNDIEKEYTGSDLTCKVCSKKFSSTELSLFGHTLNCKPSHNHDVFMEKILTDFDPEKQNVVLGYYCEYCQTFFKQTSASFCSYSYAKTLHSKMCKGLKNDTSEAVWDHCAVCRVDLSGENILKLHQETVGHKIIELNCRNDKKGECSDDQIDLRTAEYNFMIKYLKDIINGEPSLFGAGLSEEAQAQIKVCETMNSCSDEDKNFEEKTSKNFMLEVVRKTIANKGKSKYNGYFCDFCQNWSYSENKFNLHINSSEHNDKISLSSVAQISSCSICKLFIIGHDKTFDVHSVSEEHLTLKYISDMSKKTTETGENNLDLGRSSVRVKTDNEVNRAESYSSDDEDNTKINKRQCESVEDKCTNKISTNSQPVGSDQFIETKPRPKNSNHLKMNIQKENSESEMKMVRKTSIIVSGFPSATTRKDIFDTFRMYGYIDELKFNDSSNSAVITYKLKSIGDLIVHSRAAICVNGAKVNVKKFISSSSASVSCGEGVLEFPDVLKSNYQSEENFESMLASVRSEASIERKNLVDKGKLLLKCELETAFKKEVKVIGSCTNALALSTSSFDVYVDIGDNYSGKKQIDPIILAEMTGEIKSLLKMNCKTQFYDIGSKEGNSRKGSPYLSLNSKDVHLCNIFFTNGLVERNSELIRIYLKLDPRVGDLILIIKKWMSLTNMMSSNNLSGYAVTWMVLFYLMLEKHPVVPPIIDLRKNITEEANFIAGWDCRFITDETLLPKSVNTKTIPQLVHGFFKFYSDEGNIQFVLCPLTGELIRKKKVNDINLPKPYRSYKFNLWRKIITERFPTSSGLCLQDPIELNCNLTLPLHGHLFNKFKLMCKETKALCDKWCENDL